MSLSSCALHSSEGLPAATGICYYKVESRAQSIGGRRNRMSGRRTSHIKVNVEIRRDVILTAPINQLALHSFGSPLSFRSHNSIWFLHSNTTLALRQRFSQYTGDTVLSLVLRPISELGPVLENLLIALVDL